MEGIRRETRARDRNLGPDVRCTGLAADSEKKDLSLSQKRFGMVSNHAEDPIRALFRPQFQDHVIVLRVRMKGKGRP